MTASQHSPRCPTCRYLLGDVPPRGPLFAGTARNHRKTVPAAPPEAPVFVRWADVPFCGRPSLPGYSYCAEHAAICYIRRGSPAETHEINKLAIVAERVGRGGWHYIPAYP